MITLLLPLVLALPYTGEEPLQSPSFKKNQGESQITVRTAPQKQGFLGVQIADLTKEQALELKAKATEGALVLSVTEKSPAEKAGIAKNDIIVDFNGRMIYDSDDLTKAVRRVSPGTEVSVVVERRGERKKLQATIGKVKDKAVYLKSSPFSGGEALRHFFVSRKEYGLTLGSLTDQLRKYFGAPEGKGVLVEEVAEGSPAEKAGFEAGDVILQIGSEPIEDLRDVRDGLEDYKEGEKAEVGILRRGVRKTIQLPIEDDQIGENHSTGEFEWQAHIDQMKPELEKLRLEVERTRPDLEELKHDLEAGKKAMQEALRQYRITVQKRPSRITL